MFRGRRWASTTGWVLLVVASMAMMGHGIVRAGWYIGLPAPAEQEASWIGARYVYGGCLLSFAAAAWSHLRNNPMWVTVSVGLPGVLVGWATWDNPYSLMRHLAAVIAFPFALAGAAGVLWARGYRRKNRRAAGLQRP